MKAEEEEERRKDSMRLDGNTRRYFCIYFYCLRRYLVLVYFGGLDGLGGNMCRHGWFSIA